jgi:hypothetical protein
LQHSGQEEAMGVKAWLGRVLSGRGRPDEGEDLERLHDGRRASGGASQEGASSFNPQALGPGSMGGSGR